MFPLIAISIFFILGIVFFAIGKDDFGIKRIKAEANDTSNKEKEVIEIDRSKTPNKESIEENEEISSETSSEKTFKDKTSN